MKGTFVLLSALLCLNSINAQTSQKGSVKLFNSGNAPLSGVQVIAFGATPTDTDSDGNFLLSFPSMNVGNAISIPQIYKSGYELVNDALASEWILSEKRDLKLVMAPEGTIQEAKAKYYKIGSENYSAKYSHAVDELNRLYHAQEIDANQRKKHLDSLNTELNAYMLKLEEYSLKFARINPDDLDAVEQKAFNLVNNGDIDGALKVYNDASLVESACTKLQGANLAEKDASILSEAMYRYADLCDLAGGKENEAKATATIAKLAELFPNDFNCQFTYLLRKQLLSHTTSQEDIQNVLKLASNDKSLTTVLMALANHYMRIGEFDKTLDICSQVMTKLSNTDVSMQSGDILGAYYSACWCFAETLYKIDQKSDAIKEYKDLAKTLEHDMTGEVNEVLLGVQTDMLFRVYEALAKAFTESDAKESERYIQLYMNLIENNKFLSQEEAIYKRFSILSLKANTFLAKGDLKSWANWIEKSNVYLKELYMMKPNMYGSLYITSQVVKLLSMIEERTIPNVPNMRNKIDEFSKYVESKTSELSEQDIVNLRYFVAEMHTINYRMVGDEEKAAPYILKMKEYSEWLYKYDSYNKIDHAINGLSTYLELILKDTSKKEEALNLAYALDALCSCADLQGKTYSPSARSNIAVILMQNGKYDIAVESFEIIRKEREAELKKNPNNQNLQGNLSSTYNNLSTGYYYIGKYNKAYEIVSKAVATIEPFYNNIQTRTTYATNYFSMILNASVYAYLAGENDEAVKMMQRMEAVAKEMSNIQGFATFPVVAKLYVGDFKLKNGDAKGKELVDEVLKYKKGMLANDWMILYIIDTYKEKGGVFVK
jgi:hypothetical protein